MSNIRWLLQKDIKSIIDIQKECPCAPQWTRKDYIEANKSKKKPFLETKNFPIIYVYEIDKKVVGFINYKVYLANVNLANVVSKSKISAENFVLEDPNAVKFCLKNGSLFYGNIISFCVHPDFRRRGIGSSLFDFVKQKFSNVIDLSKKNSTSRPFMLFAKASEKDLGVLNFLKKINFYASKISWNYFGRDHDAYNFCFQQLDVFDVPPKGDVNV